MGNKQSDAGSAAAGPTLADSMEGAKDIVVVLDESGSMATIRKATIDSINEFINEQKDVENARVSLIKFNTGVEVVLDRKAVTDDLRITEADYRPDGVTALYDAIGAGIQLIENKKSEKVIFVIVTDGQENASKTYNRLKIAQMIADKQKSQNWDFVYLGANIDAFSAAQDIGCTNSGGFVSSADGITQVMKGASKGVKYACQTNSKVPDASSFSSGY